MKLNNIHNATCATLFKKKNSFCEEIDHAVCIFNRDGSLYNGKISKNTIIVDPWIGKVGFAQTVFKASGKLVIDGAVYDAISEGEYIEKDSKVKVVAIKNNNIIVKKI